MYHAWTKEMLQPESKIILFLTWIMSVLQERFETLPVPLGQHWWKKWKTHQEEMLNFTILQRLTIHKPISYQERKQNKSCLSLRKVLWHHFRCYVYIFHLLACTALSRKFFQCSTENCLEPGAWVEYKSANKTEAKSMKRWELVSYFSKSPRHQTQSREKRTERKYINIYCSKK